MAVVRVIAVDPFPRAGESDLLVYQVPENSRALELLQSLFNEKRIEWVLLERPLKPSKRTEEENRALKRESRKRWWAGLTREQRDEYNRRNRERRRKRAL